MAAVTSLEVFISFSQQDIEPAETICTALEANDVRCWMAHRDIIPGRGYLGPLLEAADHCRVVVVILSSSTSTATVYVLERVAARSIPIIFVMLDRVEPPAEFKRFKQSSLAIDASAHPLESNLRSLVGMVKSLRDPHRAGNTMSRGFVDHTLQHGAKQSAPRAVEQVPSEKRGATHDTAVHSDRLSERGSSPSQGRQGPPYFRARPIASGLGQVDSKVGLGLALASLSAIAFVFGMYFHAEINGLLDTIGGFARHLGSSQHPATSSVVGADRVL